MSIRQVANLYSHMLLVEVRSYRLILKKTLRIRAAFIVSTNLNFRPLQDFTFFWLRRLKKY